MDGKIDIEMDRLMNVYRQIDTQVDEQTDS